MHLVSFFERWIRLILLCPIQKLDLSNLKLTDRRIYHSFILIWQKLFNRQQGLFLQKLNLSGNPLGLMDSEDIKLLPTSPSSLLKHSSKIVKKLMVLVMKSSLHHFFKALSNY